MEKISSRKLAEIVESVSLPEETEISGVSTNSREINPGDAFLALKGEKFDGHDFAFDAYQNGAALLIVSRKLKMFRKTGRCWLRIRGGLTGCWGGIIAGSLRGR